MKTMNVHREAEFVISTTPGSLSSVNEYPAIDGDGNKETRD